MIVYENLTYDGHGTIAYLIKLMAVQEKALYPKFGEIIVDSFENKEFALRVDDKKMTIKITGYKPSVKGAFICWTLIENGQNVCSNETEISLSLAENINYLSIPDDKLEELSNENLTEERVPLNF